MLYVIGDSHSGIFGGYERPHFPQWPEGVMSRRPGITAYHIGPALAWNLPEPLHWSGFNTVTALVEMPAGSRVLLAFGEIDCRAHIAKRAIAEISTVDQLVESCVSRYWQYVLAVRGLGFAPAIWAVIPSARDGAHDGSTFATFGTSGERNAITRAFNAKLKERCGRYGPPFLSIFEDLIGEDGLNKQEYYSDGMHVNGRAWPFVERELGKLK